MKAPTIALIAAVALVSILRGSGVNTAGVDGAPLPSMPMAMAQFCAWLTGNAWPMLASFVGGLGAFITGSNTVSDMLFGNFQWNVATALNYSVPGHYIIVAVCAVLGMIGHEGPILRRTVVPFTIYGVVVGIVCFILLAGA